MPAPKITSQSPWHVVAVADVASDADEVRCAEVLEALQALAAELTFLSQGTRPYFQVSLVENVSPSGVLVAHGRDADVDDLLIEGLTFEGERAPLAKALGEVAELLQAHPGDETDFTPYVLVVTSGRVVSVDDIAAAEALRVLPLPAGPPNILVVHFEDSPDLGYNEVAGRPDYVFRLSSPDRICNLIPPVGSSVQDPGGKDEVAAHLSQIQGSI
jgi:hypothetical protein